MYLSIDFEDIHHDLKRELGIWKSGDLKSDLLWEKYLCINNFLNKQTTENKKHITFFCTACLAEKEPSLIKKIADDGHEVACHSYFHESLIGYDIEKFEYTLRKAKDLLESTSQKKILGFRAPFFKIEKQNASQYKMLEKIFNYDSSFFCEDKFELEEFILKMGLTKLKIIPITSKKIFGKTFRLGGSYLKLFPERLSRNIVNNALKKNMNPHLYLHPYEFDNSREFAIDKDEFNNLSFRKKYYWKLRQKLWLNFNNSSVEKKLVNLIKKDPLKGNLLSLL